MIYGTTSFLCVCLLTVPGVLVWFGVGAFVFLLMSWLSLCFDRCSRTRFSCSGGIAWSCLLLDVFFFVLSGFLFLCLGPATT